MMFKTSQVDPLTLHIDRALLLDALHSAQFREHSWFSDCEKGYCERCGQEDAGEGESCLRGISSGSVLKASFAVLPDWKVQVWEILVLTMKRAITSVATCVAKGENVGNIAWTWLQVNENSATITLADHQEHPLSASKANRGPRLGTLPEEVRRSFFPF
jgi:hypothetical protein